MTQPVLFSAILSFAVVLAPRAGSEGDSLPQPLGIQAVSDTPSHRMIGYPQVLITPFLGCPG